MRQFVFQVKFFVQCRRLGCCGRVHYQGQRWYSPRPSATGRVRWDVLSCQVTRIATTGSLPPMSIAAWIFSVKKGKNPEVRSSKGRIPNFTRWKQRISSWIFPRRSTDSTSVDVRYSLFATRDICIDQTNSDDGGYFHAMSMAANYLSPMFRKMMRRATSGLPNGPVSFMAVSLPKNHFARAW